MLSCPITGDMKCCCGSHSSDKNTHRGRQVAIELGDPRLWLQSEAHFSPENSVIRARRVQNRLVPAMPNIFAVTYVQIFIRGTLEALDTDWLAYFVVSGPAVVQQRPGRC